MYIENNDEKYMKFVGKDYASISEYCCTSTVVINEGIYLMCQNGHFEPVICVQDVDITT